LAAIGRCDDRASDPPLASAAVPTLSEAASKRLLARYGIPVLDERTAGDADGAVTAADAIGYPVVVKLCGDAFAHKTERGLVRLARYKQPRGYEIRAELPRTDSGKLLKRVLRDEHWRGRDRAV
jgi:acyl-CoA synthetase (AMP-forming)/AMP-acid ligase II